MTLDLRHVVQRRFVRPGGVFQNLALGNDGEIAGVAHVRAMRGVIRSVQKSHRDVGAREIDHRRAVTFSQFQCLMGFTQYGTAGADSPCAICGADLDFRCHVPFFLIF